MELVFATACFALYCKNMKVYVQQYCALGRQYLLIKKHLYDGRKCCTQ